MSPSEESGYFPNPVALRLSAVLAGIYARDDSETANLSAIGSIRDAFQAEEAALFFVKGRSEFRVCLAGARFPVALSEEVWRSVVRTHHSDARLARFGPWAIPGIGRELQNWLSARLYSSGDLGGYVFLGNDARGWDVSHETLLSSVTETIAPIVEVRRQRDLEESNRRRVEAQLARNESRLRHFFEGSPEMIYTADPDDRITSVNAAALRLLGRGSRAELLDAPFASLALHPEDRGIFLDKLKERGFVEDYEIVLVRPDGNTVFCLETAHSFKNADGTLREIHGIVKDISERIENERNLWRTNLELADANLKLKKTQMLMVQREKLASIGQLAAGVAHEINNPLGFLYSNFGTLERYIRRFGSAWGEARGSLPQATDSIEAVYKVTPALSDATAVFEESRNGFERIRSIVANLKTFARTDSGQGFEPYDVNSGLENSLVVAWNEIKYAAEVEKKYGEVPLIKARGGEINQVFLNILVNAAQAIAGQKRREKGRILLETHRTQDTVVVSVRDDGPGMPEETRSRVFDPFFSTKDPGKGTGLGMSISYDIVVNKHGGSIWLESEPGEGATFFVALPIDGPRDPHGDSGG